jgi:integrase
MKEFESYLRKQKKSADNIRNCIRVVKTLTNKVIAKNDKFKSYGVKPISYKLPENISTKGKKVELTDEEIEAIRTCEGLTPKQVEYRDLFMLEILTGQRASDIHILFDSSLFTVRRGYFCFITKKEKVPAKVKQTPEILEIITRYKDGFKYIDINSGSLVQNESTCLKLIGRKAGLNRIIEYVDNEGIKQSKPLCDLLSSHYGRHTFVTKMARIMTLEDVKYLTGHKDTQSLTKNYLHQTEDDVIDILENAFADKSNSSNPIVVNNDALNVIFAYDSFISITELMNKNNDVFHLNSTKQAIKVMKDISKLNSYSKDANVSKVQELEQVIFELSYYFRDTLLYSVYKHKESYFGMQVEVPSTQDVEIMFAQEDLERPQKQIQADIEAWENR